MRITMISVINLAVLFVFAENKNANVTSRNQLICNEHNFIKA